jgi:acyl carrier protein
MLKTLPTRRRLVRTPPVSIATLQTLIADLRDEPLRHELTPQTRFVQDLGLASLELIGLVYLCEQTFGISLVGQPGLLAKLLTVGQTLEAIDDLCRAQGTPPIPSRDGAPVHP